MSVSKFEDLVRDYAERQQRDETAEPVRRQTRIKWWQDRVGELVDDITQWLSPLVESGSLRIERSTAHLEEESLGRYEISSVIVKLGPKQLMLKPLATVIIGALGRIDVTGPNGKATLLLASQGDSTASPEDRMANVGWFISRPLLGGKPTRPQRRELRPLTQETFQDLFTDLFGIG